MKKQELIKLVFVFFMVILATYNTFDSLLDNRISIVNLGAAIGISTSVYLILGKKTILPLTGVYFVTMFGIALIKGVPIDFQLITLIFTLFLPIVIDILLFGFLMHKVLKMKEIFESLNITKSLLKYLLITIVVAAIGSFLRTTIAMILYQESGFFAIYAMTFLVVIFGLWLFNGSMMFLYYLNEKVKTKDQLVFKIMSIVAFSLVAYAYGGELFEGLDTFNFSYLILFLYIIVGIYLSFESILFFNLIYILIYSFYYAPPTVIDYTLLQTFANVNLVLITGNFVAISVKLINIELSLKKVQLEKSYESLTNVIETTNKYLENIDYISAENNLFSQSSIIDMFNLACEVLPVFDKASCYFYGEEVLHYIAAKGYDVDVLNSFKISTLNFDLINKQDAIIVNENFDDGSISELNLVKFNNEYGKIKQSIRFTIGFSDQFYYGMSFDILEASEYAFDEEHIDAYRTFSKLFSVYTRINSIYGEKNKISIDIILSLIRTVGAYDEYTRVHSEEVANLTREIAKILELDHRLVEISYFSALVHDIGKIGINPSILNKKGKLTDSEFDIIKKHTIVGYDILNEIDSLKTIAGYIRHHHERWDGYGYPDNKKGEEIHIVSQILGVCDSVSAMMHDRVYSKAKTKKQIIQELEEQKGKQFSPVAADAMIYYLTSQYT